MHARQVIVHLQRRAVRHFLGRVDMNAAGRYAPAYLRPADFKLLLHQREPRFCRFGQVHRDRQQT